MLTGRYDSLEDCDELTSELSPWYKKPSDYAMHRYAYYMCFKCKVRRLSARAVVGCVHAHVFIGMH